MSLQVWLPLNGDLTQQGASGITIVNNGATVNTSGKIGSCYTFNGSTGYIALSGSDLFKIFTGGTQQFSITMWIFHADTTRAILFGDYATSGGIGFNIELSASHSVRFYWNGSPDTYPANAIVAASGWTHVALTYDGTKLQSYINGVEKGSWSGTLAAKNKTSGEFRLGRDNRSDSTAFNGRMNDFRIYDHCLSAAEVKEISQGLVLHYKLDQNITVGENIMPNSLNMGLGSANPSTGTWRTAGTNNMTRSRVAITDTPEGSGYGFQNSGIQTANDGSCYGIDNFPTEANTEYVISMWARITAGTEGYAGFAIQRATPIAGWQVINKNYYSTRLAADGSWTKCWISFKTNTATTRNIYIGITTGDTSVTTQMCNVHIEKGSLVDSNIIKDSSGYNYNGTITGNTEITFNSARYYQALNYDGGYIDTNMELNTTNSTISMWLNIPSLSTSYHILDARNSSGTGKQPIYSYNNGSIQTGGSDKYVTSNSNFLETNKWIFITIVQNENNILLYKNGTLFQTIACTNTSLIKPTIGARYTHSNIYHGQMSDFRIYATALSADDILSLYHTSAKVDNKQNFHTFELIENNSGIKINKCGQTLCNELAENTATKFYKTNQNIETNEIIEL